jgi:hypothetical protein
VPALLPRLASEGPFALDRLCAAGGPFLAATDKPRLPSFGAPDGALTAAATESVTPASMVEGPCPHSSGTAAALPWTAAPLLPGLPLPPEPFELPPAEPGFLQLVVPWPAARCAARYPALWHLLGRKLHLLEGRVRSGAAPGPTVAAAKEPTASVPVAAEATRAEAAAAAVEAGLPGLAFAISPRGFQVGGALTGPRCSLLCGCARIIVALF